MRVKASSCTSVLILRKIVIVPLILTLMSVKKPLILRLSKDMSHQKWCWVKRSGAEFVLYNTDGSRMHPLTLSLPKDDKLRVSVVVGLFTQFGFVMNI